ncbi:MAG: hypothetical protein CVV41_17205 [Candidatus Riflebacteria bacterium HGW-Riflebacteria-1]|nr:MAG: hypothetical protein CVV41_17205 [Candidatus Riflebacteria bacterium HGW-Riflebacteria-1]
MRKFSASLLISAICGLFVIQPGFVNVSAVFAQEEPVDEAVIQETPDQASSDEETVPDSEPAPDSQPAPGKAPASGEVIAPDKQVTPKQDVAPQDKKLDQESSSENLENAEILFEEALELKRSGNLAGAIDSFSRAIRMDRSILANDDKGLIEDLKKDCEAKLKAAPDDVKTLEMLGFVFAVCYSDYTSAIACYQKVYDLVTDDRIKERTGALIDRLKMSAEVQQSYQQEVTAGLRDERLKSWSEMERVNRFGEESARIQQKSSELADAYKSKDELANRVPQLEQELKELQDEYEKANRLFYSVSDNAMYERRRRRLKDDVAAKEKEVEAAKAELSDVESTTSALEKELAAVEKAKEESPIRSYDDDDSGSTGSGGNSGSDSAEEPDDSANASEPGDVGDDSGDADEKPLPTPANPDFPPDEEQGGNEESGKNLDDLIENL